MYCTALSRRPIGLKWRSSSWMVTFVIGLGVAVDLLVYSMIIPVIPFHLERLGHSSISSMTGWLLFAFATTIPIAMLSERYKARKMPLIAGLFVLVGSQIMLMEAPNYAVMCIARILQGIGSSIVWVIGLALLCDTSPPSIVGLQLGIAMCGMSIGFSIGPPVGGLLYDHFGYRGPFIFGISATVIDLIGRLIIIERKDALVWGLDPAEAPDSLSKTVSYNENVSHGIENSTIDPADVPEFLKGVAEDQLSKETTTEHLSLLSVIVQLSKSPRALAALFVIFVYGVTYSIQEPSIPLHLQDVWNLNSKSVGLVMIAAVVPTLFSSPLAGYFTDKRGAEWVSILSILLALPWWGVIIIERSLALFIVCFAFQSFFTSGVIAPLTAELAAVSRTLEGVGYAHVYGAFNLVYGVGTSIGPIVGGQIYDNVRKGWLVLCVLAAGLLLLSLCLVTCFTGVNPVLRRLNKRTNQATDFS
ncbi:MFS-type transporter ppzB [Psilocybe cubensis]|uniref:MFS-type transporter ppzB n=1 Tax=Psilocybe cubensis TaxID=181762 RepID=A0ACB8HFF2_PSICU|nr:MFS-type transporter ppzB [Psilocybe cubensis]KAH9486666.1 MFS-type transporter ppzB [Psilocybe cubensis]